MIHKYQILQEKQNEIVVKLSQSPIDYSKINKRKAEEFNKNITIPRTWVKFNII